MNVVNELDMSSDVKVAMLAFLVALVGVLVAALIGVMHANGVLVDEFTTGSETITLVNIQAAIVIIFMLAGGIVGLTAER